MRIFLAIGRFFRLICQFSNWSDYYRFKKSSNLELSLNFRNSSNTVYISKQVMGVFKEVFIQHVYSPNFMHMYLSNRGDVVLDIGANVGYFSFWVKQLYPNATIIAVEPVPANFALLEKNLCQFKDGKVFSEQCAITGEKAQSITINLASENQNTVIATTKESFFEHENVQKIKVKAMTIRELIAKFSLKKVDILKMDCEGSEYDIFYNDPEIVKQIRAIAMEVHDIDSQLQNIDSLNKFIVQLGYKTNYHTLDKGTYMLYAERNIE